MPAKDRHHDGVVRALRKAGWTIVAEQVALTMPTRRVWIDIRACKEADNLSILVEVKGFGGNYPMDTLIATLVEAMTGYAGRDLNGYSFLTHTDDHTVLTILSVGDLRGQHFAMTSLVARVAGEHIVIEHDLNDKPLVDALVAAGVPRRQIILAYAGESGSHAA